MNLHRHGFPAPALIAIALAASCASSAHQGSGADAGVDAAKRRASLQIEAKEYADAVRTLQALVAKSPKDDQAFTMLGDAYRGLGDFANATRSYEQAIRLDYGDYLPHLKLGVLLMENGRTGRALTEFEIAVKFGDSDPLTHYNYGLALNELGRRKEALPQWRAARELDPSNPEFVAAVGIGLTGVDDQGAVETFQLAQQMGMAGASFDNNYALALERVGRNEEAQNLFRAAVAANDRRRSEYRRNLARSYLRVGKNEDAAREFATLLADDGGKWSDTVYLARARVATAQYRAAIDVLSPLAADVESGRIARSDPRIDAVPPGVGEALAVLGMAWRGLGDLAQAREHLRRAAALEPGDPSVLNNYGVVLAESGMLPDAKAQWRRVLEIDPANATAKANLSAFGQ